MMLIFFAGLVKQPDTIGECSTTELFIADHVQNDTQQVNTVPICSNNLTFGNDDLMAASDRLQALARDNVFIIHNVPGDGNCLFNAIAYQLRPFGVTVDISKLRSAVANNLEENSEFYRDFLAQPMASNNSYNADTETP